MAVLEDLRNGAVVSGIVPNQAVEIVSTDWIGNALLNPERVVGATR